MDCCCWASCGISRGGIEPCTIQCMLAMGTIPQLQCKKCLCLYHHECIIAVSTTRSTDVTSSPSERINSGIGIIKGLTANGYICEVNFSYIFFSSFLKIFNF